MRRLINMIRFEPTVVVVDFDEVYPNGVVRKQLLEVPFSSGRDYLDEVTAAQSAINALIEDVLEDTGLMVPLSVEELMDAAADLDDDEPMSPEDRYGAGPQ